uniref:Succinate dehydrogenase hydrophobic subunit n=1 Tax=Cyanidium caldarium TaxID=2771 RepID=A0A7H0WBC9_CYACA|nr:succinate dehydrogenase hydrophobic subunit [Cyanidium caldarium]QNR39858.1 succinate dehydrogenase hydrophobic subunit [Cyanidium caldarium]
MKTYIHNIMKKFEESKLFLKYLNISIFIISIPLILLITPALIIFLLNIFLLHSLLGIKSVFFDYLHYSNIKIVSYIITRILLLCLNFLIYSFII